MALATIGADTAGSGGTTVTANAAANTKGASATISASAPITATGFWLTAQPETASADYLLDVLINDVVTLANILISCPSTISPFTQFAQYFPLDIASGASVKCQVQSTTGGSRLFNTLMVLSDQHASPGTVITIGATTADSGGTSVDPGGTINTKNTTYTQLTASSAGAVQWLIVAAGNQANADRVAAGWLVTIATGGVGAESDILANLEFTQDSTTDLVAPRFYGPFKVSTIAAGTRFAATAQCGTNDATDRLLDIVLYGGSGDFTGAVSTGGGMRLAGIGGLAA